MKHLTFSEFQMSNKNKKIIKKKLKHLRMDFKKKKKITEILFYKLALLCIINFLNFKKKDII